MLAYQKAGQRLNPEIEAIPELMANEVTVDGTMPISHLHCELGTILNDAYWFPQYLGGLVHVMSS